MERPLRQLDLDVIGDRGKILATHFRPGQMGKLGCQVAPVVASHSPYECLRSLVFPNR